MRERISQDAFASIVTGILDADPNVQEYVIKNKGVSLSICAPIRRENVNAFLDFDDRGAITGQFSHAQTDTNAQMPREIGKRISDEIKKMLRQ